MAIFNSYVSLPEGIWISFSLQNGYICYRHVSDESTSLFLKLVNAPRNHRLVQELRILETRFFGVLNMFGEWDCVFFCNKIILDDFDPFLVAESWNQRPGTERPAFAARQTFTCLAVIFWQNSTDLARERIWKNAS